ncbi:MAG TPA: sporulation protein YqfC [Clostridiales bacterium]|nr:sporulation protein YqfC [Clostridiales bacterium]
MALSRKNIKDAGKNSKVKGEKRHADKNVKEKLTEVLELPKEVILNIPKMTIIGNKELVIENYKGIIEYGSARIRINTGTGLIKITGNGLNIKEITSEDVIIGGDISSLEFQM